MYGVMLIAVLVITGGAIAFIGDRLGSKIGKKKISLFGMRPRDTSTLITVATGIIITTLTFAILAMTSENVRTALFGMEKLNRTMAETKTKLETASSELKSLNQQQEDLKKYARELADGNRELEKEKIQLTAQNGELAETNAALTSTNDRLVGDNDRLSGDNDRLQERNAQLREGLQIIREGEIIFQAGEVIASGVVSSQGTRAEIESLLGMIMQIANKNATARLDIPESTQVVDVYKPEYEAAIDAISRSKQDVVVRIVAAGNLIRGESVKTSLELFRNHVIYRKNEYIISRDYDVDAPVSRDEAEALVMDFLQVVNNEAVSKGILPDPIRGSVGVMEAGQLYDIIEELVGMKGKIIINAFALTDTDVLGPLRIQFKLGR